jgi:ubiquinone/menaquinone biosynthesis C-methylase UbiE
VGSGRTLTHIPQTLRYTGIDVSAAMLTIARRRALERQLTNVRLEKMDAKALTFADEKFDLVIAPSVLSAMDDPAAGFKEMVRVVKTGGRIIVIMNLRKKNSLKHSLLKLLGPFTRNVLGYRVDLSLDDLKIPSNVQIREERLINKNLGLYFSTWLVLEKR